MRVLTRCKTIRLEPQTYRVHPIPCRITQRPTNVIPTPIEDPRVIFGVEPVGPSDGTCHPRAGEVIDFGRVRKTVRVGVPSLVVHGELLLTRFVGDGPVHDVDTLVAFFGAVVFEFRDDNVFVSTTRGSPTRGLQ